MAEKFILTAKGQKKLGNLIELKDLMITEAMRQHGGGQSQIEQLRQTIKL